MNKTKIDWTDYSWNVVTGCSKLCPWCYAKRISDRFGWSFTPTFHEDRLDQPSILRKSSRIFACSMGDLFDPAITFDQILRVFAVMWFNDYKHTFQVLTKRPERMAEFMTYWAARVATHDMVIRAPLHNVWLGTSVTNQEDADERIPHLIETPAAVRWLSCEPLLGPVDLSEYLKHWEVYDPALSSIGWCVIGGQTGPGAVAPKPEWIESIVAQCKAAQVPIFLKGNLAKYYSGEMLREFPAAS